MIKLRNFHFFAYVNEIFNFITETSSWAHFKGNFVLRKKIKKCITLKWIFRPHHRVKYFKDHKIWKRLYIISKREKKQKTPYLFIKHKHTMNLRPKRAL